MGDILLKGWASIQSHDRVMEGDPLTRMRGVCPECGNRTLHMYPFIKSNPHKQVFLWCECGLGDFCSRDDRKVGNARLFEPSMFTNGWFRGLARKGMPCSKCGANMELLDTTNPNLADAICPSCGHYELVQAPVQVPTRPPKRVATQGEGTIIQFRPRRVDE
ncbi:MAG: hypothetical protein Q4A07_11515 [Coriobacteriales bacterium]|nr:hypothetical protein [Coriobacteriales bacterium]